MERELSFRIVDGTIRFSRNGVYFDALTEDNRGISFSIVNLANLKTLGVSNITEDRKFVLFLDYDDIELDELESELKYLSKKFLISHFFVFRTGKRRFHAISFEKFELDYLMAILKFSRCDYRFKEMPLTTDKSWILRVLPKVDENGNIVSPKPEFVNAYLFGQEISREISRGHFIFYSSIFPELKGYYNILEKSFDMLPKVKVYTYGTSSRNLLVDLKIPIPDKLSVEFLNEIERSRVNEESL